MTMTQAGETGLMCGHCRMPVRLEGGDPLLPDSMRRAVHVEGAREPCAGGETLAAPLDPAMVGRP